MPNVWLRWAGSKRRSLRSLRPLFERYPYDFFVEPFVGAGCVFFSLNTARRALLSDINSDLIDFYNHLRQDPSRLRTELTALPSIVSRRDYYQIRNTFNKAPRSFARSAQFFLLNRLCFNGVYRVNRFGQFNVPMGSRNRFRLPTLKHLEGISAMLKHAALRACDFTATLRYARPGALFYIDPPYAGHADRYAWPPFREAQLCHLAAYVTRVAESGASVIVSYAGTNRPAFVPRHFNLTAFNVYRSVSVNGSRADRSEICAYYP